jgi:lincosamide nucleotidyltransferase
MNNPKKLLKRLDEIGTSLSKRKTALALIGLGSVGIETDRLDEHSDLDFFAIVKNDSKTPYLESLDWLSEIAPIAYAFQNTVDGYKVLYEDGVFCEFAVFEEKELETAVFSPGRIVWKADGVDENIRIPKRTPKEQAKGSREWMLGEALTNLYIGLAREKRGEKLSAARFIQSYAVDRCLELAAEIFVPTTHEKDAFNIERRYEQQYPEMAEHLPKFMQGYEKNTQSAKAILSFLDEHFEINETMKAEILTLVTHYGTVSTSGPRFAKKIIAWSPTNSKSVKFMRCAAVSSPDDSALL